MYINDEQLREFLSDSGLVSQKKFDNAVKTATEKSITVSEVLVSEGEISEDDLRRSHAYVLGIPFVNLSDSKPDLNTLALIPEPIARRNNIVAFRQEENNLEVAMLDTDDLAAIDFVKKKTQLKILPRLTDAASIKQMLRLYQKTLRDELGDVITRESQTLEKFGKLQPENEKDLRKLAEGVPAVRVLDSLLRHAIVQNASDIHIEPQEDALLVRYRIDGILHDAMSLPSSATASITARVKILANLRLDEKRLPQDGRFRMETDGDRVSFRVSVLPTYHGEKTVMRLLREDVSGFTLESLGFHGEGLERSHDATRKKTGLILVTGPTGSGKSTTLYTMLDILNTADVNISTVEDPIEYQMKRINQTQVRPDIGFTFSTGLRSLVRQDPDIIMVGEIRDRETAALAINAALTGHLVLSTLHTNSAAGAVPRLIDMGVEPFLLASTLQVVIGQRLVRTLCNDREEYKLSAAEIRGLEEMADLGAVLKALKEEDIVSQKSTFKNVSLSKEKPTKECETGYSGRKGIQEVLPVTEGIKKMILSGSSADAIEDQARKEGMLTMLEDGIYKSASGTTSLAEVLRVVSE
ncbi:type II/IV secretion system protein [Candidatus Kaiserbacteria bacterium]|nr:MAG: type II/IV secretion system protein [Candidatus Kaiserbacteria bacterium]